MSYYIAFPIEEVGEDSVQAFMTVDTYHTSPPGLTRVMLEDYDILEWSYNPDDRLMVPGMITIHFKDLDLTLDKMLFGDELALSNTQKVKIEIRVNSALEFIGYSIEDGIESDEGERTVAITFAPEMDKLNNRMIVDEDGEASNPEQYAFGQFYPFTTILTDLFQTVNPAVTYSSGRIKVQHSWKFLGYNYSIDTHTFYLTDIFIDPQQLYNNNSNGMKTYGDVLKALATEFGCFAGMIHQEKGFFKQLYNYESNNLQSVDVVNRKKGYRYGLLDYVKTIDLDGVKYDAGTFTEMEDRFLERENMLVFGYKDRVNNQGTVGSGTNIVGVYNNTNYSCYQAKDDAIGGNLVDFAQLTADWWLYWRNKKSRTRVDWFELNGIGYDFLKSFNYDGSKYQIISMKKHLSDGYTEVEAFYLGEL